MKGSKKEFFFVQDKEQDVLMQEYLSLNETVSSLRMQNASLEQSAATQHQELTRTEQMLTTFQKEREQLIADVSPFDPLLSIARRTHLSDVAASRFPMLVVPSRRCCDTFVESVLVFRCRPVRRWPRWKNSRRPHTVSGRKSSLWRKSFSQPKTSRKRWK